MTTSHHEKVLPQIGKKPGKYQKFLKHNTPRRRTFGGSTKRCRLCGRTGGHINKYGLNMCRECFRNKALKLNFKKYN